MDMLAAKQAVIAAGKRLVETGLIARTWGNVSARIDQETFVITPSGKAYENLTPEDIVEVKIRDLSYEGDVKPSSEKGIHAQAYALRPDAGFVIHTHQNNASIAAVMGKPITVSEWWVDIVGATVPIASYGLPGTGKLKKGVVKALLQNPGSNAILMAHHGALCIGSDAESAFKVADSLEQVCLTFLKARALTFMGEAVETLDGLHALIAKRREANAPERTLAPCVAPYSSFRSGDAFCMAPEGNNGKTIDVSLPTGIPFGENSPVPETLELHRAIYKGDKKVNAIVHSQNPDIIRVSKSGKKKLLPFLDDAAQIAGINLRSVRYNPNSTLESAQLVKKGLKCRNAVLLEDNGAICTGSNMDEARAVEFVTAKNCGVSLSADLFEKVKPIGLLDSVLMRTVYVLKYSKKK